MKKDGLPHREAIDQAVQRCITEGYLEAYLRKKREEAIGMLMLEFDQKAYERAMHEEGFEEARQKFEKEIEHLGKIIQITTFNMHNEIKKFKNVSLEKYYKELNQIDKDIERNAKINDEFWDPVIKDKNISQYK